MKLSGAPLPLGAPVTRRSSHPIVTPLDIAVFGAGADGAVFRDTPIKYVLETSLNLQSDVIHIVGRFALSHSAIYPISHPHFASGFRKLNIRSFAFRRLPTA